MTQTYRQQVSDLLNPEHRGSRLSVYTNWLLIGLIVLNVVAICLETVEHLKLAYAVAFLRLEIFTVIVFSLEYALRIWSSAEQPPADSAESGLSARPDTASPRRRYILSFSSLIDLLAIVPLYISLLFGIELKALIALRLLRLLKLVRYFSALVLFMDVLRAEARSFAAAILVLLVLIFISASGIYFFECEVQPEQFGSVPQALWWATVTLTTLGYGDVVPVTVAGKIFAAMMTIFSVGIVALPAGMLASRFSEELHNRKQDYSRLMRELASDGELSYEDLESLEQKRSDLLLTEEDTQALQKDLGHEHACPHCNGSGLISTT